jgi:hypothetical protein
MTRTLPAVCCAVVMLASAAAAQRRVPPASPGAQKPTVDVTIALKSGSDMYQFTGQGTCTYAPIAAIYNVVSEQWNVQQSDGSRSVQLTLWKPKNGSGEMFSLSVSAGGRSHTVNTVKATGAAASEGSGKVTLATAGNGGTFTVDAKDARAAGITGTIKCGAFTPAIAEGGN